LQGFGFFFSAVSWPSMPLDPAKRRAYEAAEYVVFFEPELVFRVGEPSAELDAVLESLEAETAAFVTAANPHGERRPDEENREAHAALLESPFIFDYEKFEAEGRDPLRRWPAEQGLLLVGIPRRDAEALGVAHDQNAIVFIEKGKPPELVVLV
jgi:hypothetical protein